MIALADATSRLTIENHVANNVTQRQVTVTPSINLFASLEQINADDFASFVKADRIDIVVVIEPFAAEEVVSENDWEFDTSADLRTAVAEGWTTATIVGEFGVEIIAWETTTWTPVWAGRSGIFVAETDPDEIGAFVVGAVRRPMILYDD